MDDSQQPPVVACSLSANDLGARAARWQALAERADLTVAHTRRGLRLTFTPGPGVAGELEALAALERDCCAFATWSLREAGDRLTLEVSAVTSDGIAAVRAMFGGP
jgi:hypothetical protein